MAATQKWQYRVCACQFKITKAGGIFHADEGYWTLTLDSELSLVNGLQQMGDEGYELAGIQVTNLRDSGGANKPWYAPSYFYVFKKPLES